MTWFAENAYNPFFTGLLVVVGLIICSMVKDKKSGKPSCGGNCNCCKGCLKIMNRLPDLL